MEKQTAAAVLNLIGKNFTADSTLSAASSVSKGGLLALTAMDSMNVEATGAALFIKKPMYLR